MLELNQIYCGDCLELMKELDDGSVNLILCDLPYGTTACSWDTIIPFEPLWAAYKRIIKPNGAIVLTASQPFTTALIASNMKMFKYEWIWEKSMPSNFALANRQPMKYHENIIVFYSKQPTYNKVMTARSDAGKEHFKRNCSVLAGTKQSNHINSSFVNDGKRRFYDKDKVNPKSVLRFGSVPNCNGTKQHPTQKPVALMAYLIRTYTNKGELVLDNCAGSGTTGVAAKELNRKFILIEQEQDYCDIANERLGQEVLGL